MGALCGKGSIAYGPVQNIILTCTFMQTDLFLDSIELYAKGDYFDEYVKINKLTHSVRYLFYMMPVIRIIYFVLGLMLKVLSIMYRLVKTNRYCTKRYVLYITVY